MKPSVFRPLQLALLGFLAVVLLGVLATAWLTLREQRRLAEAEQQLGRVQRFERVQLVVAHHVQALSDNEPDNDPAAEAVTSQIGELIRLCLSPESPAKLERLRAELLDAVVTHHSAASDVVILFQEVSLVEQQSQAALLAGLHRQAALQLKLELATPLAILAGVVLLFPIARRRIIKPLEAFGRQLSRLAKGDLTPAPLEDVDPLLLPLHQQLNDLIRRLAALEEAHQAHARSLEAEVRTATRTLLEQHRSLARAERLAATGELAASVAHELRNPLAAIQMTLSNLRAELPDTDLGGRIDLVLDEVGRLTRLLNQLLDSARHAPEPPRRIELRALVEELLTLTRCQVAANVCLSTDIAPSLTCVLPPDRLRQALLNLILNSAAAMADGGVISVAARRAGERVQIVVSDDGPGFPAQMLQAGTRPFLSTREHGTGLGLAMVRRFARDVGGDVQLANRQPRGAVVTLNLPADLGRS
jgi:two-component system NtrC family sensor kinase